MQKSDVKIGSIDFLLILSFNILELNYNIRSTHTKNTILEALNLIHEFLHCHLIKYQLIRYSKLILLKQNFIY